MLHKKCCLPDKDLLSINVFKGSSHWQFLILKRACLLIKWEGITNKFILIGRSLIIESDFSALRFQRFSSWIKPLQVLNNFFILYYCLSFSVHTSAHFVFLKLRRVHGLEILIFVSRKWIASWKGLLR